MGRLPCKTTLRTQLILLGANALGIAIEAKPFRSNRKKRNTFKKKKAGDGKGAEVKGNDGKSRDVDVTGGKRGDIEVTGGKIGDVEVNGEKGAEVKGTVR